MIFHRAHGSEEALDTVIATEIYTEQGHDAAAVAVHGMVVTSLGGESIRSGRLTFPKTSMTRKILPKEVMFSDFMANFVRMSIFFMLAVSQH